MLRTITLFFSQVLACLSQWTFWSFSGSSGENKQKNVIPDSSGGHIVNPDSDSINEYSQTSHGKRLASLLGPDVAASRGYITNPDSVIEKNQADHLSKLASLLGSDVAASRRRIGNTDSNSINEHSQADHENMLVSPTYLKQLGWKEFNPDECSICCEIVRKERSDQDGRADSSEILPWVLMSGCGHCFHIRCIKKWMTSAGGHTCPLCRSDQTNLMHRMRL